MEKEKQTQREPLTEIDTEAVSGGGWDDFKEFLKPTRHKVITDTKIIPTANDKTNGDE